MGQLLAMAHENGTLTHQPDSSYNQRTLIGFRHEAAHQVNGKAYEWRCFSPVLQPLYHSSRDSAKRRVPGHRARPAATSSKTDKVTVI
jgi:hypothetical protein